VCCKLLKAIEDAASNGQPLLTHPEIAFLRQVLLGCPFNETAPALDKSCANPLEGHDVLPLWDGRRLWLGETLLKEFNQPAPFQTALLDAFQKQGWSDTPAENPLPRAEGESENNAKHRLHDTIKNLNRCLPPGTIRFRGDGTGKGVIWVFDR
jgi:hypothetical protein